MDKQKGKKLDVSWLVKLNIMILSFLFVLFLIKQTKSPVFQTGLSHVLSPAPSSSPTVKDRSAKIKLDPK